MILEQHNSEFVHIQKDFRESFRDSLAKNPNAKFDTHWNAALTGQFFVSSTFCVVLGGIVKLILGIIFIRINCF